MGIPGLWDSIAEAKECRSLLAIAALNKHRARRIAVDISIWAFQCAAAHGGGNPSLRTFYARLCRLANSGIIAVFVFDGAKKPKYKRGKRTKAVSADQSALKRLIELFGFVVWQAPGEAEAECARLQILGIVDAVLSDDVDALMFGATVVYKNWAAVDESGQKTTKVLTHTLCFRQSEITKKCRLTVPGLVLIALLSGGDYFPAGVAKCGIRTATEVAAAGYGESLLQSLDDLERWRESLQRALSTNENGHFRCKHPAVRIPQSFPDLEILHSYIRPCVSNREEIFERSAQIDWHKSLDSRQLRSFTMQHFDWQERHGDAKLIRTLAQPALTREFLRLAEERQSSGITHEHDRPKIYQSKLEGTFSIHGSREHKSSDHVTELRISYVPLEIIPLKLHDLCTAHSSQHDDAADAQSERQPTSSQLTVLSTNEDNVNCDFDFHARTRVWVLRSFVEEAFPHIVKLWEEAQSINSKSPRKQKTRGLRNGTLDGFITIGKIIDKQKPVLRKASDSSSIDASGTHQVRLSESLFDKQTSQSNKHNPRSANGASRKIVTSLANHLEHTHSHLPSSNKTTSHSGLYKRYTTEIVSVTPLATPKQMTFAKQSTVSDCTIMVENEKPSNKQAGKKIVLRKSLPGVWREARCEELEYECVEVIDLTGPSTT